MESDGLFVYGTLREGGSNHAWLRRTGPEGLTRAWVAGRLFHLPTGYPALVATAEPPMPPPAAGWVKGEFVGYEDEADLEAALADLDPLEGVEEGLFTREIRPVVLEGGHRYRAWVYVFHVERLPRLEREAVELADGDWAPYLSREP
ncbi:gamma-glutamylcyclotransferase [Geothrix sp. 21YS21S-4]|uniref:gamma-glutamylcyclotransferase family protein n=1 Tax=Geothrix sp. 21YS21S-4 TaxID=3068889 RepID=UPI0027BACF45|nr:gamma-glutamylcyclotransferase family protein [Geothrix sp. 21YS21S-4]